MRRSSITLPSEKIEGLSETFPGRRVEASFGPRSVPWHLWCGIGAVFSGAFGLYWDVSWHMSIGRDSFWTPAHVAMQMCGVVAGLTCGYLILSHTFGRRPAPEARDASVRIWGFRGPLGAFICTWGSLAMLTGAPFDNWWHAAYGLDVKLKSPPHSLLIGGTFIIGLGVLVMVGAAMNRASGELKQKLTWLSLLVGGLMIAIILLISLEYKFRPMMHSALFYRTVSVVVPIVLITVSQPTGRRWACSIVIAVYTGLLLADVWIFPLFPAEPKLGPVFHKIDHFVPYEFPLLLIAPAAVLDLLSIKIHGWDKRLQAAVFGSAFFLTFLLVQWPFATFLMSPGARNRVFGAGYMGYSTHPDSYYARHLFIQLEQTGAHFWIRMLEALTGAILSSGLGLIGADLMRRIRR